MFKPAVKEQVPLKIALTGPSGSGKTLGALILAASLGKRIAVIDTENNSASLYADLFTFETHVIYPPYTTEKYIAAIEFAEKAKFDILIMDSLSHAWAGEGGLLEQKGQLDSRGKGNSYTNWDKITPKHEALKAKILNSPLDMICTMRSKQDYVLVEKNGKQVPQKMGMAPIQRDGMEYEFTVVFDISMNHDAEATKDRTRSFSGNVFKITPETGRLIAEWRANGAPRSEQFFAQEEPARRVSPVPAEDPAPAKAEREQRIERLEQATAHVALPATRVMYGKHAGKKFSEVELADLKGLSGWINKTFTDRTKMKPNALSFLKSLEAYIESQNGVEEAPGIDVSEMLA